MNLAQAAWDAIELASVSPPSGVAKQHTDIYKSQRLLWLVDELDLRLAFLDRPEWLVLPELE